MGRNQPYCCICGAPMMEAGQCEEEANEWLEHAVLLTTAHTIDGNPDETELDQYWPTHGQFLDLGPDPPEDATRRVLALDAQCDDRNRFQIRQSGDAVEAFHLSPDLSTPAFGPGGPLYMAVHGPCLALARRFIESRRGPRPDGFQIGPDDEVRSLEQLWQVLHRRMAGSLPVVSEYVVDEPHDYFGGRGCRNVYWELGDDPPYGRLLEANPLEIANLTEAILQNLQPLSANGAGQHRPGPDAATRTKPPPPPRDLRLLDPACDYTHSPEYWCDVLVTELAASWLWDLDGEAVRRKQQDGSGDGDWDWEGLVRRLVQVGIHAPDDATLRLPRGLRNRRRIWRVLEEARVDDAARHRRAPPSS